MNQLVTSKNDGDEMAAFLETCNFKVTRIHDEKESTKILSEYSTLDSVLAEAKTKGKIAAFIYYSGHGV